MDLTQIPTEDLRAEISRRFAIKQAERKAVPRCRNCKFMACNNSTWKQAKFICKAKPKTVKYKRNIPAWGNTDANFCSTMPGNRACDKYERVAE